MAKNLPTRRTSARLRCERRSRRLHGQEPADAADVGATSVREEPGVLCIFPMRDAEKPTSIRIVEIYRDEAAYKAHLATPNFLRYMTGPPPHMIESLRLAPMCPLDPSLFPDVFRKSQLRKE